MMDKRVVGYDREKWITLNLIGVIAGLIILVTILLPWISITINIASPFFSFRWDISLVGFLDLINTLQNILTGIPCPAPCPLNQIINLINAKMSLYSSVTLVVITLLIVGGIVTFFHGFIGGAISLIGIILFSVLVGDIFTSYNIRLPLISFEIGMGVGFILIWVASVLALVSQLFRLKAPHLVSITIWRKGAYYGEIRPVYGEGPTTERFNIPFKKCPKCGLENSAGAIYCRNCGTKL